MQARSISMNWKQARRTENNVDGSTVMPTKTSARTTSRSKTKPIRAHSWHDSAGVQNETAERNEAFRRAIFAIPSGKVSTYGGVAKAAGYPGYHRFVSASAWRSLG